MTIVKAPAVIHKAEVRRVIDKVKDLIREALPEGSFAERETAVLAIANEACCEVLIPELQEIAVSFPDEVMINGLGYRRHAEEWAPTIACAVTCRS